MHVIGAAQYLAWSVWPVHYLGGSFFAFFVFLFASSYIIGVCTAAPAAAAWRARAKRRYGPLQLLAAPLALTAVLAGFGAVEWPVAAAAADAPAAPVLNATVELEERSAIDVRLNWSATGGAFNGSVINPSLLWLDDGTLVRAARVHAVVGHRQEGVWKGEVVTEIVTEWQSDVAIAAAPYGGGAMGGWDVTAWRLDAAGAPLVRADLVAHLGAASASDRWGPLCERIPRYVAANATLMRTTTSGAEDPKLVALPPHSAHGRYAIAFSSYPPASLVPGCHQAPRAVTQMYLAADGEAAAAGEAAVGSRVGGPGCGWTRLDEKNWVAFTKDDQLYFVYSIFPHTVVVARAADGLCVVRYSTSSFAPMAALAATAGLRLHGSGTAVRWGDDGASYLATFHTVSESGEYTSFAYTFDSEPPFAVTAVSRPLPLAGGARSFVSGLALKDDKVVVTYGYANRESRALVMSRDYFAALWEAECGSGAE